MLLDVGRLQVDRVSYLLQEIYGIENKNNQETKVNRIGMLRTAELNEIQVTSL